MIRLFFVVFFCGWFLLFISVGCMLKKGWVVELVFSLIVSGSGVIIKLFVLVCYQVLMIGYFFLLIFF